MILFVGGTVGLRVLLSRLSISEKGEGLLSSAKCHHVFISVKYFEMARLCSRNTVLCGIKQMIVVCVAFCNSILCVFHPFPPLRHVPPQIMLVIGPVNHVWLGGGIE